MADAMDEMFDDRVRRGGVVKVDNNYKKGRTLVEEVLVEDRRRGDG